MQTSQNFNYFTDDKDPKKQRSELFKKIWKWTKIVFYVFLFGITLTGCVQSFVIKSSNYVGNGLEFYLNKKEIAPKVNTFKNTTKTETTKAGTENVKYTYDLLSIEKEKNVYVNDKNVLAKLQEQTTQNNGTYGEYGSYSSAIQIIDAKNVHENQNSKPIFEKNGKYLFTNSTVKNYSYVNDINADTLIKTFIFVSGKQENLELKKDDKGALIANENGEYVVTKLPTLGTIANYLNSEEAPSTSLTNKKYARDILQAFYDYTFGKDSAFVKSFDFVVDAQGNKTDFSKWLDAKVNKLNTAINSEDEATKNTATLSAKEKVAIDKYLSLLNQMLLTVGWIQASRDSYAANVDQESHIINAHNDIGLALKGDYESKPITTWGEAWWYGPFYGLLVYPLAVLTQALRQGITDLNGWGSILTIIIVVIVTRLLTIGFTWKQSVSQSIQEDMKIKKAAIEAKYKGFEDNKAMKMRKNQELQQLNKKFNINPLDVIGATFITMPIFIAMWRVIQALPEIKSTWWLGINFATTSYTKVFEGAWQYILLIIVAVAIQLLSQLLPQLLVRKKMKLRASIAEREALKKSERTQRMMMIVFTIITVIFTAGVQVYWTFTGLWSLFQTLLIHRLKKTQWFKDKYSKKSLLNK
ncbi:membrane protein insertase YidC [Mycoplasmopsis gallinacea]|uniref:Putative inner membrane protein translocase component YidC n=1 Tax=Mycoplasmopsis gallinacea TaxID=29556 RepID=A0A449A306_9BACT|nr:membrane protein insertase YidC [Mycoplasmopsis gallinacea]VEU58629.1 putative inner membrane protein translocase component YidC [Mycoplasmopsis gallinacea]